MVATNLTTSPNASTHLNKKQANKIKIFLNKNSKHPNALPTKEFDFDKINKLNFCNGNAGYQIKLNQSKDTSNIVKESPASSFFYLKYDDKS